MTAIDQVLATEKASAQRLEEAKTAAAEAIVVAKKSQITELEAEKVRLQEVESTELTTFENNVAEKVTDINKTAEKKVAAIESTFSEKASSIAQKIKQSFA